MIKNYLKRVATVTLFAFATQVQAIEIDLGSLGNLLRFSGTADTFTFRNVSGAGIPLPGSTFQVNGVLGTGDSLADRGRIDGTWAIGDVLTSGDFQTTTDLSLTSGTSKLFIWDGGPGNQLAGTISWASMFSLYNPLNNTTTLGINGNVSGISYSGSELDLQELRDTLGGIASLTISFSFAGKKGLTQLKSATGNNDTSFSGDLDAVVNPVPDGGFTLAMLGAGFVLMGVVRRKIKV